jgi:hypothetical protein
MVFITGDTHGEYEINRLSSRNLKKSNLAIRDDYLIVCGDFGLIWADDKSEKYWLNWLEQKPFHTLFVDGNHENFSLLNSFPIKEWNKGSVHAVRKNVLHLMRGHIFEIEGKRYFTFGGAQSHDIQYRVEGKSWWKEEIPSNQEMEEGYRKLESVNWQVDYIITHTAPTDVIKKLFQPEKAAKQIDQVSNYLESIRQKARYSKWFFGHFHKDIEIDSAFISIYKKVLGI